jgi:hypothetical protein
VGGLIRSALAHLEIDRCPRCLKGRLTVDLDRVAMSCSKGCSNVAGAVGEAAPRLTGGLRGEGEALMGFCAAAEKRPPADELLYGLAVQLPASLELERERIVDIAVGMMRRAACG